MRGCLLEDVTVSHGRIHRKDDPAQGEEYTAILTRHGLDELTVDGENTRPQPQEMGIAPAGAFGDYLVPVNADVPTMDVIFVGEADSLNPIGTKGIGEIGLVGIAAALANAINHATGKRIRDLPIALDKLLS